MAAKKKKSILLRILFLIIAGYIIYNLCTLQAELISKQNELKTYTQRKEQISLQIKEYERLLDSGTEKDIIEQAARERLGYVFSDEQVFIDISGN